MSHPSTVSLTHRLSKPLESKGDSKWPQGQPQSKWYITYIACLCDVFQEGHYKAFTDILGTERPSEVGLHGEGDVGGYEGLE